MAKSLKSEIEKRGVIFFLLAKKRTALICSANHQTRLARWDEYVAVLKDTDIPVKLNKTRCLIEFKNGSRLEFKTLDEAESLQGRHFEVDDITSYDETRAWDYEKLMKLKDLLAARKNATSPKE